MARGGGGYFNKQLHTNKTTNNGVNEKMPDANRAACAGLIFMCNKSTKMDCFKYGVFGLSEKKRNLMDRITKGMHLFLFDVDLKLLYGIFAASSCGAFMLEPSAFGGNYPWQVKFHIEKYCLPLEENIFKEAIKDNYFTMFKFKIELNAEQVQKLVSLFSPLLGPVEHPGPIAPNYSSATPYINEASTVETGGYIQDEHMKGYILPGQTYANETVQSDCLPKLNPPHNAIMTKNCLNGCHVSQSHSRHIFLPPALTCEASKPDGLTWSALPRPNREPQDPPLNQVVVAQKCMYNCHIPTAKHEHRCAAADPHQLCRVERDAHMRSSPIYRQSPAGPLSGPLSALCATTQLKNIECNHIRTGAELYLGNLASYMHLPLVRQWHLITREVHENSLERRLSGGELMSGSSSVCSHAEIAATAPGLSSSLGHDCTMNMHKRPLQDTYTHAVGDAPMSGERPLKCACHEVHNWRTDDILLNAVDIIPASVHIASYLSRGSASLSHSNKVFPQ